MKRILPFLAAVALLAACRDSVDPTTLATISAAFQSVPLGFDNAEHSFAGASDGINPEWGPHGGDRGRPGDGGHGGMHHEGGPGFGNFMGGGLGGLFFGDGFGSGFGRGRGSATLIGICTYSASTGRITCDPVTSRGLTTTRSAAYQDASGASQTAFDSATTNSINLQVTVSGTIVRRDGDSSRIDAASDRTVSGLLGAQRTVNGTSRANENTSGNDSTGHFTAVRLAGDTTSNVVIPAASTTNSHPYPTAGTVTRSMQVTFTRDGESPVVSTRREVITYDGSATARIVITHDGTTKNCTVPLPRGRMTCE